MKYIICLVFVLLSVPLFAAEEVLLRDFSLPWELVMQPGNETPGGSYSCGIRDGAAHMDCDLSGGGVYSQFAFDGAFELTALRFTAAAKGDILLRIRDNEDEIHQIVFSVKDTDTHEYGISVNELEKRGFSFPDSKNKKIDLPVKTILIGVQKKENTKSASLDLYSVYTAVNNPKELQKNIMTAINDIIKLTVTSSQPGCIFYQNETSPVSLSPQGFIEGTAVCRTEDGFGRQIGREFTLSFNGKPQEIEPIKKPGIYFIKYTLTTGNITKDGAVTYAVIPKAEGIDKDRSFFGVNTHFNQGWDINLGAIAQRLGISWIRDGEADLRDSAHRAAEKYGLKYMPCFTGSMCGASLEYAKKEVEAGKKTDSEWDFTPYIQNYGEYADKFGYMTKYYDIVNEPHNFGWSQAFGGSWDGGPWFDIYWQWAKQVTAVIREHQKDAVILWEDLDPLNWSDLYIKYGINKEIDYLSPHTYNLVREKPLPEEQDTLLGYEEWRQKCRRAGVSWRLIIGEVGFSAFQVGPETGRFYAPNDIYQQAARTIRMAILHINEGVERIFYYDLKNDGFSPYNQEHNFGLVYYDGTPKPAGIAYANLINICDNAEWTGRDTSQKDAYVFGFTSRTGQKGLVCWTKEGSDTIQLPADKFVTIIDLYGKETKKIAKNGKITIGINEYPQYILF